MVESTSNTPGGNPYGDSTTRNWVIVQRVAAIAIIGAFTFFPAFIAREFIPIYFILSVPFLVALIASVRWARGGGIAIGVLGLLLVLAFIPDIARDMSQPESVVRFMETGIAAVAALTAAVGAFVLITRRGASAMMRPVRTIPVAAVVLLVVVGASARLTMDTHAAEPGDVQVVMEKMEFLPETIEAAPGTINVHIDNRDWARHDFVIDELDVEFDIPERTSRRFTFEAPAGTYEVYCSLPGHGKMTATLVVR